MTIPHDSVTSSRDCCQAARTRNTLRWDLTPEEIRSMTDSLMDRVQKVYDEVGSLNVENVSVENTLKVLADVRLDYACKPSEENCS